MNQHAEHQPKKKKMEMLEQKSIRNERSTKWTSEQIVDCRRKGL